MRTKDSISFSLKGFENRKSRAIFTILSVAVGIAAILFLVSLGFGLQRSLLEKITTEESLLTFDIVSGEAKAIVLKEETLKKISEIDSVKSVSPHTILPSQIVYKDTTSETSLNLIKSDWFKLSGVTPIIGETLEKRGTVVINSSVVELFNIEKQEILGKKIKLTPFLQEDGSSEFSVYDLEKDLVVVGILEGQGEPPQAFILLDDANMIPIKEFQFAKVSVDEAKNMESVREQLLSMGFLVSALSDTIDQANKIFKIIQIVLGIFGIIALIVAAIGLINTMTITLLERTNEIGIMKAIGASQKDIKRLFLAESTTTGFLGGLSGIIIGLILSQIFNWIINILARTLGGQSLSLFHYPFWFLLFIIILSTLVGFLAGFWPAKRASKLNPLEALRYK